MFKKIVLATLLASAAAFAPSATFGVRTNTALSFEYGEFDDELWDNEAKKVVYEKWDPNSPRTTRNFNPFETFKGNSPDASGIYPGENRYKDPIRGDVSFKQMMEEKAEIEERNANPKDGDVPGAPGCKN
uniref:PS II complex 12 kDa extrinsic protein n=1 Tax=Leptocylindrus danicus TaxID=163516 RepID=A0A7S2JSR7_9STRA|mmetsp:Transcript_10452/g.15693  ORF Transcript_10452/g.15693 Transcript_10452/m.15693 type:complete len:130 (+) Transcript_10452:19-408(+)